MPGRPGHKRTATDKRASAAMSTMVNGLRLWASDPGGTKDSVDARPPISRSGYSNTGVVVNRGGRLAALVGCLFSVTLPLLAGCGGPRTGTLATNEKGGPHVVHGGRGRATAATLEVVNGATAVTVSSQSLGNLLYRVSTPVGSGIRPLATRRGGTVLVGDTGAGQTTQVLLINVILARGVRWTIDLDGGATTETVNMGAGSMSALDFGAGVSMASVQLPNAVGTQTVTLAGGGQPTRHRGASWRTGPGRCRGRSEPRPT